MKTKWYFPKKMENSLVQPQMDEPNFLEEIRNWEHPPWYGNTQFEEKVTLIFLENQKGLFHHHLKTHIRMPGKRLRIFGACQETSYTAITLNPESNFTRREKNHSLFHWNLLMYPEPPIQIWMLCKNAASTTIGTSMDQEICLILGQVSLSLLYWKRNLQTEKCSPGGDWQDGKRHPGHIIHGQNSGSTWEEMLSWRRDINGPMKNRNSRMPEDYEEFISLTLRTRNSKKPPRMLARNWIRRWLLLCLARHARHVSMGVTRGKTNEIKSKFACVLEASEPTRLRVEDSLPHYHQDHIAGKGENSLQHCNLVHKLIPMPQATKIPAAEAAVDKEWEKLEKFPAWDLTEVRSKKEVIDEARTSGGKVHFASSMDICHLKNAELEAKHQKNGRIHFHPQTFSSNDTFIQKQFHPMTLSSKNCFMHSAGDASHEGLLKPEKREFRCLGLRVKGLEIWCLGV